MQETHFQIYVTKIWIIFWDKGGFGRQVKILAQVAIMANSEQPSFSLRGDFGIVGAFNVTEVPAYDPIQCSV